jgi:uncharacterized protein with GYD domain
LQRRTLGDRHGGKYQIKPAAPAYSRKERSALLFYEAGRGLDVATYIALVNFTDQGVRHIRHTTERAKALIHAAANFGVRIKDLYWTMGAFDAVFTAEAPDDETITAFAMSMGSLGNIRTQTLRAFSADEMTKILAKGPAGNITGTNK